MEKYRKFEDQHNGINPFIPNSTKKRSTIFKIIHILQICLSIFWFFSFLSLFAFLIFINIFKQLLFIRKLKRMVSIISSAVLGRLMLYTLGVYSLNYKHRKNSNKIPNIIISSQSSVIDWVYLYYLYAPRFLWIVKSEDSKNDFFIELGNFEVFFYSIGLKFPNLYENPSLAKRKFDIHKYVEELKNNGDNLDPLVIFPENTKTNRKGVLSIKSNLIDNLFELVKNNEKLLVRSEILSKNTNYMTLHNTTDALGLKTLFFTCCENLNISVEIYSVDVINSNFSDENNKNLKEEPKESSFQFYLFEPMARQSVVLNCVDHRSFLNYYHQTIKDSNYVKKSDE